MSAFPENRPLLALSRSCFCPFPPGCPKQPCAAPPAATKRQRYRPTSALIGAAILFVVVVVVVIVVAVCPGTSRSSWFRRPCSVSIETRRKNREEQEEQGTVELRRSKNRKEQGTVELRRSHCGLARTFTAPIFGSAARLLQRWILMVPGIKRESL